MTKPVKIYCHYTIYGKKVIEGSDAEDPEKHNPKKTDKNKKEKVK